MQSSNINSLIYRSYLTSSLVPIFAIEVVLLVLYFGINFYISERNQETLLQEATENIQEIASREASSINSQLREVSRLSKMMQRDHEAYFNHPDACYFPNAQPVFGQHENGAYYKLHDNGGGSLYYSNTTRMSEQEQQKALCSEMLDPLLQSIVETSPIVTQAYLNTWDDMNRLYPFMPDAPGQYGPAINMEDYNFYYEADAEHNPERNPVWTGAYLDPAGQGWMVSVIVPIYRGDFLEGVSGLDVTIGSFVQNILSLQFPWNAGTFMVDSNGTILAMQNRIETILGLKELGGHVYQENIKATVEKPEEYNLLKNSDDRLSQQFSALFESQARVGSITISDTDYLISQEIVPETGWRMMTLVEKSHVFAPILELKALSNKIGYLAIALMVIFYVIFFLYLMGKSKRLTRTIAKPIEDLSTLTQGLGHELKSANLKPFGIREIDDLIAHFNTMTAELEARTNSLMDAKLEAEAANIAKSRFLNVMSHELQTPLNAVVGMANLLTMENLAEDKRRHYLSVILQSGRDLSGMISGILDFSNIDTNNLTIHADEFSLSAACSHYETYMGKKAVEKQLTFLINVGAQVPDRVVGDQKRLEQVLANIGSNAIKFTEPGGCVELDVSVQARNERSTVLHFAVSDTGIGIDPKDTERLFDLFSQADDSSTRKYGGAGVGLALSKKLVELMGGEIWVESEPGKGSTFHFTVCVDTP